MNPRISFVGSLLFACRNACSLFKCYHKFTKSFCNFTRYELQFISFDPYLLFSVYHHQMYFVKQEERGFNETLNMSITRILTLEILEMLLVLGVLKTSINLSLLTSKNASLFHSFNDLHVVKFIHVCSSQFASSQDFCILPMEHVFFLNHYLVEKHLCSTCFAAIFLVWFSYHLDALPSVLQKYHHLNCFRSYQMFLEFQLFFQNG